MKLNAKNRPRSVIFFANGLAAVCDRDGNQLPRYQVGHHFDTIKALQRDGINYRKLEITGQPDVTDWLFRRAGELEAEMDRVTETAAAK